MGTGPPDFRPQPIGVSQPVAALLAGAGALFRLDYVGDAQWDENETAKNWYAPAKSGPPFRPLLPERLPGMALSPGYANLDF